MNDSTPVFGRLRADFIEKIRSKAIRIPDREILTKEWQLSAHVWTSMFQGGDMEWHNFQHLLAQLRRCLPEQVQGLTIEDIAEPAPTPQDDHLALPDLMGRGWASVLQFFKQSTSVHPHSFCDYDRDADFIEMADLILDSLGRLSLKSQGKHKSASREAARTRGEELSGLTFESWVPWLRRLCKKEMRTVLFAVTTVPHLGKYRARRLGSSIMLSLKKDKWLQFKNGEIGYSKLTEDDLQRPSQYILLEAIRE